MNNYEFFEETMREIFERVYDEEVMAGRRQRKTFFQSYLDEEKTKKREEEKKKYMEKVKEYTSYKIGRKMSQNSVQYR